MVSSYRWPCNVRHALGSIALLCAIVLPRLASAQVDLALVSLDAPRSGCQLGTAEIVSVIVRNFGATLPAATNVQLAYRVNAGSETIENLSLASAFGRGTERRFSLAGPANLGTPGNYTVSARVSVVGDANAQNDRLDGVAVVNDAASVGGTLGPTIPTPINGTLALASALGIVEEWQQSVDGLRWRTLVNPTHTQGYTGIATPTRFRVQVRNGTCPPALSTEAVVLATGSIFANGFEP